MVVALDASITSNTAASSAAHCRDCANAHHPQRPSDSPPSRALRDRPGTTTATLVDLLKRHLKANGITYAQVAARLALSEASGKRMFSRHDFTRRRMEEVCQIAGIELADLARELTAEPTGVTHLSVEQEQEIYRGETFSSTCRRTAGIANAYRQRGTYMSCDYRMTTPYQGTGTCNLSTGAQYQVHIGG